MGGDFEIGKSKGPAISGEVYGEDKNEGRGKRKTDPFAFFYSIEVNKLINPMRVSCRVWGICFHRRQLCGIFYFPANRTPLGSPFLCASTDRSPDFTAVHTPNPTARRIGKKSRF